MHSDCSLELSILYIDRWMIWCQVKKMSSSLFSISAWLMSHYFFEHCNHDFQYLRWLFYLISFYQLLDDTVNVMKMFQYQRSWWVANSLITYSHNSQTLHLSCLITNSIFSSFTDINMSLIFFVNWLWLLKEKLSHEWKLCMMTFLITQLNWSCWVKYSSSSWVLDSKSVKLNWIFFEKVLSWVEKLNSRTWVKLRSLTRQFNSTTQLDSTRY